MRATPADRRSTRGGSDHVRQSLNTFGGSSRARLVALAATALLGGFVQAAQATTIEWHARFPGFRPGDVWFAGTLEHSSSFLDRPPAIFVYSPPEDRISEITSVPTPTKHPTFALAFDPTGSALYVGDVGQIQMMTIDGVLVPFAATFTTLLDLTVGPDGAVYTAESHHLRRYVDGVGTTVAVLDSTMRGLAAVEGGFVAMLDPGVEQHGSDNLVWLSPLGEVRRGTLVGGATPHAPGKVRALPDGMSVVAVAPRSTLHLVTALGAARAFADHGNGMREANGLAIDARRGGLAWVATGTGDGTLMAFTTDGARVARVPLQLKQLGYPRDAGFISATGIACVPGAAERDR